MQPVADLRLLEVAEERVDCLQRLALVRPERHIPVDPRIPREIEDALAQRSQPSPVHARGRVILVEQRLEVLQRPIALGPCQRRHQMIDDHRPRPAFRLRAFAGVVDDERIKMRQLTPKRRRIRCHIERRRLPRQPLEAPMLAVVDDGMGAERVLQPQIRRDIRMRWHQVRIVIRRALVPVIPPRRLQQHYHIAKPHRRQMKRRSTPHERISFRLPPPCCDLALDFLGQGREQGAVPRHVKCNSLIALRMRIRRTGLQEFNQVVASGRQTPTPNPSPQGGGGRKIAQGRVDGLPNSVEVGGDVSIPQSQHPIPSRSQERILGQIVTLRRFRSMRMPIEFNDESRVMAGEVRKVRADRHLPPKVKPVCLEASQHRPEHPLRRCRAVPQLTRPLDILRPMMRTIPARSTGPPPSPLRGGAGGGGQKISS